MVEEAYSGKDSDGVYLIVQPKMMHMGPGAIHMLAPALSRMRPSRIMMVTDPMIRDLGVLEKALEAMGPFRDKTHFFFNPAPDPSLSTVEACASFISQERSDLVIGLGGGSPLDVAKGAAALAVHPVNVRELLGRNLLKQAPLPTILIPTTSGTGTEASQAAVMEVPEENTKKSIWDPRMVPEVAIVDPELTISMPPALTAETGLDALYHGIEGFTSLTGNPTSGMYCLEAVRLVARYLKRAYDDGTDLEARDGMSRAATLAGIGFSNGGLGAIHGLALAFDSSRGFSHGKGLAVLGPWVVEFNSIGHESLYVPIAEALGIQVQGRGASEACRQISGSLVQMALDVGVHPYLADRGINESDLPGLGERAYVVSQRLMPMNIRQMSRSDVLNILRKALSRVH